jgi:site-specific DNA-methyltransferase (cytosine-N4-specific)
LTKDGSTAHTGPKIYHETDLGKIIHGDALEALAVEFQPQSIDLIVTSPPYGLVRKKDYGNVAADEYLDWFRPFAEVFKQVLKSDGSLVIDIGGAWVPGSPTRSLYHYELLIMLCKEFGFHLAQDFFWWNPCRLPTPAEWVTVRRIRVKDAVDCIWWLSPSPYPRASNRRVLQPYSDSMKNLLQNGYRPKKRPSGHDISEKFGRDNKAAIPPNLITLANTESNSAYLRYCQEHGIKPNPARFPVALPEFFIRMLTDPGDIVVDPFGGSCATGEAAERTERKWVCVELEEEYLKGAVGRFKGDQALQEAERDPDDPSNYYKVPRPGLLWNGAEEPPLPKDGGKKRPAHIGKKKGRRHGKRGKSKAAKDKSPELF